MTKTAFNDKQFKIFKFLLSLFLHRKWFWALSKGIISNSHRWNVKQAIQTNEVVGHTKYHTWVRELR